MGKSEQILKEVSFVSLLHLIQIFITLHHYQNEYFMSIEDFLASKKGIIEAILLKKKEGWMSDDFEKCVHFCILVYASDTPLIETYQHLKNRIAYAQSLLGIESLDNACDVTQSLEPIDEKPYIVTVSDMVNFALELFLTRHQFSYEYEHLVTCQIVLMSNNKELRSSLLPQITDINKRIQAASMQGDILDNNTKIMGEITKYTQIVYGENKELAKEHQKGLRVEDFMKK